MPLKRGKFSARFPAGRIKKIMQVDKEVGKVSATVPPVVSRALELFVENLVCNSYELAKKNNLTKTISVSHLKYVIESDTKFAFARKLVENVQQLQMKSHSSLLPLDEAEPSLEKKRRGRKSKRQLTLPGNEASAEAPPKKRKYVRRNTVAAAAASLEQQSAKRPRIQQQQQVEGDEEEEEEVNDEEEEDEESVSSVESEEEEDDDEDDDEEDDLA